ncbi:MAG: hypothetical protein JWM51_1797 [Microbacteriaceae bacterium]|nr:hypothetical protein [Microbacteriaceae bacterium]
MTIAGLSIAAVITGGALTAAALPAVAEAETPTSSEAAGHRSNGITEEELTGDVAAKVEAAVLAEYPDATIQRLETDAEGDAYEAHILQADGTRATVKLNDTFAVTGLETGGHGGGARGDADTDDSTSTDESSTSGA